MQSNSSSIVMNPDNDVQLINVLTENGVIADSNMWWVNAKNERWTALVLGMYATCKWSEV